MHKVKSTHTIINIIHLILWIWFFQTYQHPRSNDINEVEEVGSQNKHKKGKKHILPAGNRFTSVGNRFPECGVQILKKNKVEIDFLQREIDFLHTAFKKSALGGIKLDLSKHTNTL